MELALKEIKKGDLERGFADSNIRNLAVTQIKFEEPERMRSIYDGLIHVDTVTFDGEKITYVFSRHGLVNIIENGKPKLEKDNDFELAQVFERAPFFTAALHKTLIRKFGLSYFNSEKKYHIDSANHNEEEHKTDKILLSYDIQRAEPKLGSMSRSIKARMRDKTPVSQTELSLFMKMYNTFKENKQKLDRINAFTQYHRNLNDWFNRKGKKYLSENADEMV